jgi:hypothetical protein
MLMNILVCETCEYDDASSRNVKAFAVYEDATKEVDRLQAIANRLNDEWKESSYEKQDEIRQKYITELDDPDFGHSCIDGVVNYRVDVVPFIMGE